jgi:hypothetical protein
LPLLCGDISGAFESVLHKTNTVEYEQTGPGRYDLKCFWAPHAPELADRLLPRDATAKPGDLEHVRCGECGVPLEISKVRWDFEKGTITNDVLGVRVALFGASAIQAIFDELESELGQEIPNVIIEAQRKYSLGLATERSRGAQGEDLKLAMAVTGLGNLVQVDAKTDGYVTRIENPSLLRVPDGEEGLGALGDRQRRRPAGRAIARIAKSTEPRFTASERASGPIVESMPVTSSGLLRAISAPRAGSTLSRMCATSCGRAGFPGRWRERPLRHE